jgi:hypothetical protein
MTAKTITMVLRVTMPVEAEDLEDFEGLPNHNDQAGSDAALAALEALGFDVSEYDTEFTELNITYEVK